MSVSENENEIGLREGRAKFGDLVNRAEYAGQITYITRHGRQVAAIVPINRIAKEPTVRTVHSTIDAVDPTVTSDIADSIRNAAQNGHVERESYSEEDGVRDTWIRVVAFEIDGQKRWAMVHEDPSEAELIDSADRDEIVALYEKQVSDLINISEWTFDETDLPVYTLVSAVSGDIVSDDAIELAESNIAWDDLPERAQDWATRQGYGSADDELLYLIEGDTKVEDFPSLVVCLPR